MRNKFLIHLDVLELYLWFEKTCYEIYVIIANLICSKFKSKIKAPKLKILDYRDHSERGHILKMINVV